MIHEKNVKMQIHATRCQHFGSNYLDGKCNFYMHIFTNATILINGDMNGFLLYIGSVFGNLNAI
jgi:hypothetical protein